MKDKLLGVLKIVLGLGLGGAALYFAFRDVELTKLKADLAQANYWWVLAGIALALLSHFFRAARWKQMLDASNFSPKLGNTYAAVMVGYMVNLAIPRGGEVARCTMLYRSDKVPVSSGFGTVFTERVFDLIILILFIGLFLLLEFEKLWGLLASLMEKAGVSNFIENYIWVPIAAGVVGLIGLGLVYKFRKEIEKIPFAAKVLDFLMQMLDAALSIRKLENPLLFLGYTVAIWLCYGFMTWLPLQALSDADGLSVYFAFLLMTIGGIGMALPSPGGIGTYHLAVKLTFVAFMGGSLAAGEAETLGGTAAVIIHTSQLIMMIFGGLVGWLYLEGGMRKVKEAEGSKDPVKDGIS